MGMLFKLSNAFTRNSHVHCWQQQVVFTHHAEWLWWPLLVQLLVALKSQEAVKDVGQHVGCGLRLV